VTCPYTLLPQQDRFCASDKKQEWLDPHVIFMFSCLLVLDDLSLIGLGVIERVAFLVFKDANAETGAVVFAFDDCGDESTVSTIGSLIYLRLPFTTT